MFSFALEKYFDKKVTTVFNNSYELARNYVEEIRKDIVDDFGFDKVYKQGFNIKSPLNFVILWVLDKICFPESELNIFITSL